MATSTFQLQFDAWLDRALSQPIPPSIVAFSFNLAEPWCIEVIGSDRYSEDDPDWACEESFRPEVESLPLPALDGTSWELVLEDAKRVVSSYLDRPSAGSTVLRRADAVTVGFVDSDLHKVWPRKNT
jgi:shikimate kinase